MKDLFGQAIKAYWQNKHAEPLITETNITEADTRDVAYLFRSFEQMPEIEQTALKLCRGKILDAGCGAGCHSLYVQESLGLSLTAIDTSPLSVEVCRERGIKDVRLQDVRLMTDEKFDTILLLMNGAGMCGKLKKLPTFLKHLKSLLTPDGQILVDSSDIIYMYQEEEDGGIWLPGDRSYYGEVTFTVSYKQQTDTPFDWLYVDFDNLHRAAVKAGLACEKVTEGPHYDYLARLYLKV